MTKEDLAKALSLSCVENYFLAYFKDKFDVRKLYVESFVAFNKVINGFCLEKQTYEKYDLTRVQDTSEKLGLTAHILTNEIKIHVGALNLIRVNKTFFEGAKLFPWREDHYIAIEQKGNDYIYYNNYPLSQKEITKERLNDILDNRALQYAHTNHFNSAFYEKLETAQYDKIISQTIKDFELNEDNLLSFKSAILVLKTIRKRLIEWLKYESECHSFMFDINFMQFSKEFIDAYNDIFIKLELMIARKKIEIVLLQDKLNLLIENEKHLSRYVKFRRGKNEYDR